MNKLFIDSYFKFPHGSCLQIIILKKKRFINQFYILLYIKILKSQVVFKLANTQILQNWFKHLRQCY